MVVIVAFIIRLRLSQLYTLLIFFNRSQIRIVHEPYHPPYLIRLKLAIPLPKKALVNISGVETVE